MASPTESSITSGSTITTPISSPATTPNSGPGGAIQHLTSQFIKEGLKMKVKQNMGGSGPQINTRKRTSTIRNSITEAEQGPSHKESMSMLGIPSSNQKQQTFPLASPTDSEERFPIAVDKIKKEELTENDALRRSRRRERNKVAATKCRNKKKARTQILIRVNKLLMFTTFINL